MTQGISALSTIRANIRLLRQRSTARNLISAVKANGYGHGAGSHSTACLRAASHIWGRLL
ncbi:MULTISPECIES: alanine racemase [Actinomadura]|uniref:Alanine racemase n=1 Tax=Actinomadura yumaensis TaxID=111807 RepID=A0ABW2CKH7_9ACTN|nr:hypothetical protein [Actinomadura sp. J1-007]